MDKATGIIGVLLTLVSVLLYFLYGIPEFHDFATSVNPMEVNIAQGDSANVLLEVHYGLFYHEDVHLRAESVPSGISLHFEPETLKSRDKSVSQVTVYIDKNTSTEEHVISIIGDGPDGKEHDCKLKLNIGGATLTSSPITKTTPSAPIQISTIETSTPITEKTNSASEELNMISTTGEVTRKYTPINISRYSNCSFTVTKSTFYTHLPEGYSYITLNINIKNGSPKPISSSPSCWQFINNGISYSPDSLSTLSHFVLSWDLIFADIFDTFMPPNIKPGENSTLTLYYVVKGEPGSGRISYVDPYIQI
jgi:Telomeric repeat-binding factor 2.